MRTCLVALFIIVLSACATIPSDHEASVGIEAITGSLTGGAFGVAGGAFGVAGVECQEEED